MKVLLAACIVIMAFAGLILANAMIRIRVAVPNQGNISGSYGLELWCQYNYQITSFNWGNLLPNTTTTTDQLIGASEYVVIKNVGQSPLWVAWVCNSTLPSGVSLSGEYEVNGYVPWAQNVYIGTGGGGGVGMRAINPGEWSQNVCWILTIASGVPPQPLNFTITLLGADTQNG